MDIEPEEIEEMIFDYLYDNTELEEEEALIEAHEIMVAYGIDKEYIDDYIKRNVVY